MRKSKLKGSSFIIKLLTGIGAGIIIILMVLTVVSQSRKKELANTLTNRPTKNDMYLINEPIHTPNGSVIVSNVEEFGPNNTQLTAIIHYYNTTDLTKNYRITDIGSFVDESYIYTMNTSDDRSHTFRPGDHGLFKITIERELGSDGLYFVVSDVLSQATAPKLGEKKEEDYNATVMLNTQRKPELIEEEKKALGIQDSEIMDLSDPKNEGQIFVNSVVVNDDGEIVDSQENEELTELANPTESSTGAEGIDRQLTKEERRALATVMTDEEIENALQDIQLPGLYEWGPGYQSRPMPEKRDLSGVRVLTQAEYFEEAGINAPISNETDGTDGEDNTNNN